MNPMEQFLMALQRFDGRVAMVTGGGHGIGRATALRLASEGATVAVTDVDSEAADRTRDELVTAGFRAESIHADVRDMASVKAAVSSVREAFGQLDVLVNTAGGAVPEQQDDPNIEDVWNANLDLNLVSVMRLVRASLPMLRGSEHGGRVVTIGSVNGLAAFGGHAYSAAKAGLELLTKNLAAEYAHEGLRFNLIAPGTIDTRVWDSQPGSRERLTKIQPTGRLGTPVDIAAAVAFLASDDAAWITGVTLPVDGGILTGPAAWNRRFDS
jgi:NAD(P)-dependent dehydrogenase (short-subunit alcohol dehydrogenase family)